MYSMSLRFALWCVLSLATVASYAGESWQDAQIMPKSTGVTLQVGGPAPLAPTGRTFVPTGAPWTGTVDDIEWPAKVAVVEGQWLWIEDHGGYSVPPVAGWVRTDDMLKLDDPSKLHDSFTYYAGEVRKFAPGCEPAWLHWFIGICLESKNELKSARDEYKTAFQSDPTLLDAEIRMWWVKVADAGPAGGAEADAKFIGEIAKRIQNRPQAFVKAAEAWKKVYGKAYKTEGAEKSQGFLKNAHSAYKSAIDEDPNWPFGYLGDADLYLDEALWQLPPADHAKEGSADSRLFELARSPTILKEFLASSEPKKRPEDAREIDHLALRAIDFFDKAIMRDPTLAEAYRDRAIAYVLRADIEEDVVKATNEFSSVLKTALAANKAHLQFTSNKKAIGDTVTKLADAQVAEHSTNSKDQLQQYVRSLRELTGEAEGLAKSGLEDYKTIDKKLSAVRTSLSGNENLRKAKESALAAYNIDPSQGKSLEILAGVLAVLCDYEGAYRYQRLAIIYAPNEDRPALLDVLHIYRDQIPPRHAGAD